MRRVLPIALAALFLAVQTGDALAGGPVFAVIGGSGVSGSVNAAIRRQIAVDVRVLAGERRRQQGLAGRLRRLRRRLQDAVDPFQYEDAIAEVENAIASTDAGSSRPKRRDPPAARRAGAARASGAVGGSSSVIGSDAVAVAEHYLGVRYLWGGSNPDSGFDCSGFVKYVYAQRAYVGALRRDAIRDDAACRPEPAPGRRPALLRAHGRLARPRGHLHRRR